MRFAAALALTIIVAVAGCASTERGQEVFEPEGRPASAADRAYLTGVPFVSWNEAARLWFRERDLANPSSHAAFLMVLGYWGEHWALTEDRAALQQWGTADSGNAPGLAALKSFLDAGVPVIVPGAITSLAHPVTPARSPGLFGAMKPLEAQPRQWDPLLAVFRVLIGYDDARRIVTLHDPAFGPAWEIGYDDFDRMWALTNRAWVVMRPHEPRAIVSERRAEPPYRAQTADELAATDLVFAAALATVGRDREATERLRKGLARPDLSDGYRHLLRLELAAHDVNRGRLRDAVAGAEEAARLVPEHSRPWAIAAEAYRLLGRAQDADAAEARARQLAVCSEGAQVRGRGEVKVLPETLYRPEQRTLAAVIAHDFFIVAPCLDSGVTWLLRPLP